MNIKFICTLLVIASSYFGYSQRLSMKIGNNPTIKDASAVVEIESITKGFLPPRMTFSQRLAIGSPAVGLIVYCTNCGANGELEIFNGTTWTNMAGSVPSLPVSKVPTSAGTTLTFMAHNLGADTTVDPLLTPSWKLNGAYFQWGKKPTDTNGDGYKTKPNDGANGFGAAPTGPLAGDTNYSTTISGWSGTYAAATAWNSLEGTPIKTSSDPCPTGYRIPTKSEWNSICSSIGSVNTTLLWSSVGNSTIWVANDTNYSTGKLVNGSLYLPAAGYRNFNGDSGDRGSGGYYWSSSSFSTNNSYNLKFVENSVSPATNDSKLSGFSVRCIKV